MKAATIFLGSCGLIQIGYLPEMDSDGPVFHLRMNILIGNSSAIMNVEEAADFFSFLREQGDCTDVDGQDVCGTTVVPSDNFVYEEKGESRIVRIIHQRDNPRLIIFPNVAVMRHTLSLEKRINDFFFQNEIFRAEIIDGMKNIIDNIAVKCYGSPSKSPLHLKYIGGETLDEFILELSSNFFSFFSKYYHSKYTN